MISAKKAALVLATTGLALGAAAGSAFATGGAQGQAIGSPGILSGNNVQTPVSAPVNISNNHIGVLDILSPVNCNSSTNN